MAKVVHISEAASLAIHSMAMVAGSNEILNVTRIAELTHSSRNHLAKVMQTLVKNNLLDSTRGPKGGFVIKGDPSQITLLQIYEMFEGTLEHHYCGIEEEKCPFKSCVFGNLANKFSFEFSEYLKNTTLSALIKTT
ncbi:MAG: Rrf2 family transcriptional regulator [Lentimicrobium sp.]|jgi:Rrf2 family protein|nr:Rrf2 family transcriptional regulator [Lentimicrobium sp.]